ncbi:hypothetical protein [Micromonospora sp. AP08]|uniref:DUF6928 family protein n=1 Tax=Micromonospora sp. AP08 TaxID=2604467 RepID=UPI001652993E|nr:hypothetical protein [Micromonospora sp. AP08]
MGAKTALLAYADGDIATALHGTTGGDRDAAEALVRRVHPGHLVDAAADECLWDAVYPPDDVTYAVALPGVDLLCDRRLAVNPPSALPAHLVEASAGRRIVLHGMHSVSDWLGFAVWEDGVLVRSLNVGSEGVGENIGEPLPFELPYWAGEHPVPGWDRLPFHPLELGEAALRALFGFVVEGRRQPDDVDADAVRLHGFRVTDPTGREQAARDELHELARRMVLHRRG